MCSRCFRFPGARTRVPEPAAALTGEAGTYALEMALVMPVYLMLIFGFTSAALLLFVYGELTYASRAAVRYASVHSATNATAQSPACAAADIANSATAPTTGIVPALMTGISGGQLTVPSRGCDGTNAVGSLVTITVQVNYPLGLPYIAASGVTLSSTAKGYVTH